MNNLKVQNKVNFLKIGATHFTGKIDEYVSEFFNNRVLSDFAKNEIFAEAEDALKNPRDDRTIVGESLKSAAAVSTNTQKMKNCSIF